MKALYIIFLTFSLSFCFVGCGFNFQALRWQSGYIDDQGRIHYSTLYRAEDPKIRMQDSYNAVRTSVHQQELRSTLDLFLDPGHPNMDNVYVAHARVTLNNETILVYSDPNGEQNWDGTEYGRGFLFQASTDFASCRSAFNNLTVGDYLLLGEVHWARKACRDCEPKVVTVTRTTPFSISFEAGPERDFHHYDTLHRLAIKSYPSIAVDDYVSNGIRDISGTDWTMKQATERFWLVPGVTPGYSIAAVRAKLGHNEIGVEKTHDGFYVTHLSTVDSGRNKTRKSKNTVETLLVQFTWSAPGKMPIFKTTQVRINGDIESYWESVSP